MKVTVRKPRARVSIVVPEGRIDAISGPKLRVLLRNQTKQGTPFLIIDLRRVTFMDSSGLSALVAALKAVRPLKGAVYLVGPTPQVRMALRMTMMDQIFPVYDTVEDALAALGDNHSATPTSTATEERESHP